MQNDKFGDGDPIDSISLKGFLNCLRTYIDVKIYAGSNADSDLVFEGEVSEFLENEDLMNAYSTCNVESDMVRIEQSHAIEILIDA